MSRKKIPQAIESKIRLRARNRCGYCLSPQHLLMWELEIEHIIPRAKGGTNEEWNLWIACRACNHYKGIQVRAYDPRTRRSVSLFNPRRQKWSRHFKWSPDGAQIIGLTATGRATVIALKLNNHFAVTARQEWVSVGWHPPKDHS